jgi:hypothetical protein
MDDWLKQLQTALDDAAQASSDWLTDVSRESDYLFEQWLEASQETVDSISDTLDPALRDVTQQIDQGLDEGIFFLEQRIIPFIEEATAPFTRTLTPWLQNHPTCIGCKNYHGMTYGDSMLVCGMHPYGPEDSTCVDWESVWGSSNGNPDGGDRN